MAGLTACGGGSGTGSGTGTGEAAQIALLLSESKTVRYEAFDKPLFEAAVQQDCPGCTVLYSNAERGLD